MGMAPWFTTHVRSIDRERSRGRSRPLLVGVSENATVEMVREAIRRAPLGAVQLHREELIEFACSVGVPVVKAFGGEGVIIASSCQLLFLSLHPVFSHCKQ
jgi:anthranilate synthase / indole-3-glycerol phosphate synthase / phosphoribosylanthranilate isomerase